MNVSPRNSNINSYSMENESRNVSMKNASRNVSMTNASIESIASIEMDDINCKHKNCKCEKKFKQLKQLKQGKVNLCWLVSVLNMLLFSDEISTQLKKFIDIKYMIKSCQNLENIHKYIKEKVSKQLCAPNKYHSNILKLRDLNDKKILEEKLDIIKYLFEEFITNDNNELTKFKEIKFENGDIPYYIYIQYLSLLGYDINTVRHIVMDFNKIKNITSYNPRQFKMCRLFSDYLRKYLFCNPLNIFICTILQQVKIDVNKLNNDFMYLGKYICILEKLTNGKYFYIVYKLDCGILGGFNKKHLSHAISMVTCNTQGYILNSFYDNNKELELRDPLKSCGVFKYDWYKWNNNDFYYHNFVDDNCANASIIDKNKLFSLYDNNGYIDKENDFCYNKNVGLCNSHFYVKINEKIIDKNEMIENIHNDLNFDEYLKPYIYLLYDEINKYNRKHLEKINIKINFENIQPGFININEDKFIIIQRGIIKENMVLHHYIINVNINIEIIKFIGDTLFNCLTDDVMIIYHRNTSIFSILIEYIKNNNSSISTTSNEYFGKI